MSIQDIPRLVARCRESGPLSESALSDEELQLFDAMLGRMFECAEAAAQVLLSSGSRNQMVQCET